MSTSYLEDYEYLITITRGSKSTISSSSSSSSLSRSDVPTVVISSEGAQGLPGSPGSAGPEGPAGPAGPSGPPGTGSLEFTMTFATPSTMWLVLHNLNTKVLNVQVFTNDDELLEADVDFIDENTILIEWFYPISGYVRLFR